MSPSQAALSPDGPLALQPPIPPPSHPQQTAPQMPASQLHPVPSLIPPATPIQTATMSIIPLNSKSMPFTPLQNLLHHQRQLLSQLQPLILPQLLPHKTLIQSFSKSPHLPIKPNDTPTGFNTIEAKTNPSLTSIIAPRKTIWK